MISERDGQLFIAGDVNQLTVPALLPAGEALMAQADRVVNLSGVEAVDSSALAVLLAWMRAARGAGRQLRIVDAPEAFISLASLYGVSAILFPETAATSGDDLSVRH